MVFHKEIGVFPILDQRKALHLFLHNSVHNERQAGLRNREKKETVCREGERKVEKLGKMLCQGVSDTKGPLKFL